MTGGRTHLWKPVCFARKTACFCILRLKTMDFWIKFHRFAQMTLTSCRAIINWFDLSGFDRVFFAFRLDLRRAFRAFRPLRGKDFSRCAGGGTLTAATCKTADCTDARGTGLPGLRHRRSSCRTKTSTCVRNAYKVLWYFLSRKYRDGERPQGIMHSCGTSPPKPESPVFLNKEENTLCRSLTPSQTC